MLSGEKIDDKNVKEKADAVILDSLKYSKRMLIYMINIALIVVGGILTLVPIFKGGEIGYCTLGVALILFAVLRILLNRRRINIMKSAKAICSFVLVCQFTVLILEMLPGVMMVPFASGPNQWVTKTFTYFSFTLVGYAEYSPFLTGILTVVVFALCIINFIKKTRTPKLQNTAFICTAISFILSILPFFKYGIGYISILNYTISALILISAVLQAVTNRHTSS